jgi:hypothetical protein
MRYPASEKLEIIRTVEGSHLPVKQTLALLLFSIGSIHTYFGASGKLGAVQTRSCAAIRCYCPVAAPNVPPEPPANKTIQWVLLIDMTLRKSGATPRILHEIGGARVTSSVPWKGFGAKSS